MFAQQCSLTDTHCSLIRRCRVFAPRLQQFSLIDDITMGEDYVRPETADSPGKAADAVAAILRSRHCLVVADDCTTPEQMRAFMAAVRTSAAPVRPSAPAPHSSKIINTRS